MNVTLIHATMYCDDSVNLVIYSMSGVIEWE